MKNADQLDGTDDSGFAAQFYDSFIDVIIQQLLQLCLCNVEKILFG
jgi:hypothetical protein